MDLVSFDKVLGLLIVAGIVWEVLHRFHPALLRRRRKKILTSLLGDKKFPDGQPFKELQRRTGMRKLEAECRELLVEIGAIDVTLRDGGEGWRLSR